MKIMINKSKITKKNKKKLNKLKILKMKKMNQFLLGNKHLVIMILIKK